MNKKITSRPRRFFQLNRAGRYKMYEIVAEFVKYRLGKKATINSIEQEIRDYTNEKSQTHVSQNRDEVKRGEKSSEFEFEGNKYYVTKEWGNSGSGTNFKRLMKGINDQYTDFIITEII